MHAALLLDRPRANRKGTRPISRARAAIRRSHHAAASSRIAMPMRRDVFDDAASVPLSPRAVAAAARLRHTSPRQQPPSLNCQRPRPSSARSQPVHGPYAMGRLGFAVYDRSHEAHTDEVLSVRTVKPESRRILSKAPHIERYHQWDEDEDKKPAAGFGSIVKMANIKNKLVMKRPYFAHYDERSKAVVKQAFGKDDAKISRYADSLLAEWKLRVEPPRPVYEEARRRQADRLAKELLDLMPPVDAAKILRNVHPLRRELPNAPKPVHVQADRFDDRRFKLSNQARTQLHVLEPKKGGGNADNADQVESFRRLHAEVFRHRYVEPPRDNVKMKSVVGTVKKKQEVKGWALEDSIWWPRVAWCESTSLWDSEECQRRKLTRVYKRALGTGLQRFILKNDDGMDSDAEEEEAVAVEESREEKAAVVVQRHARGNAARKKSEAPEEEAVPTEVRQVDEVLWNNGQLTFAIFDYYAALGGGDLTSWRFNEYSKFIDDFELASNKLKRCKRADCDRIFIAVDTASKRFDGGHESGPAGVEDTREKEKSLSLSEYLHALVRLATARYIQSGTETDISEALEKMFKEDIEPRVDHLLLQDYNIFRTKNCYIEPVDRVLRKHEDSLHGLFDALSSPSGVKKLGKMLFFDTWLEMIRRLELIDADVSERDMNLCFTASRMCTGQPYKDRGYATTMFLPFEGFCEAIVRLACQKSLPTDEEICEAGFEDAAAYMRYLEEEDADGLRELIETRATPWNEDPWGQPVARCVDHLMSIVIRQVEIDDQVMSSELGKLGSINKKEVSRWFYSRRS